MQVFLYALNTFACDIKMLTYLGNTEQWDINDNEDNQF